jgi:hypothetical protein
MSEIANKSVEQKDAEAEVESFREDLGPFVVAAETTRMAMVFTDAKEADNPIIFVNDSFLSFGAPGLPLIHVNPASSRTRDKISRMHRTPFQASVASDVAANRRLRLIRVREIQICHFGPSLWSFW